MKGESSSTRNVTGGRFVQPLDQHALGTRIHCWGNSCSGKSTLARALGDMLQMPVVELDALNWQPGWIALQDTAPDQFDALVGNACSADRWVVAGSYSRTSFSVIWPRVHTVIWLDLPRWRLVIRVLRRTWIRARTAELLWGKVRERFLPVLMVWRREESLLWWIWTQHRRKREKLIAMTNDSTFAHIQFMRFTSTAAVEAWLATLAYDNNP